MLIDRDSNVTTHEDINHTLFDSRGKVEIIDCK